MGELQETIAPRRSLGARTMTEAFRLTVEDNADRVAVRTKDDEISLTWAELRDRVDAFAGGLAKLGVQARRQRRAHALQPAGVHDRRPRGDDAGRDAVLDLPDVLAAADRLRRRRCRRQGLRSSRTRSSRRYQKARAELPALETMIVLEGARGEGTAGWDDMGGGRTLNA